LRQIDRFIERANPHQTTRLELEGRAERAAEAAAETFREVMNEPSLTRPVEPCNYPDCQQQTCTCSDCTPNEAPKIPPQYVVIMFFYLI
jgi:hypothetical protein